MTDITIAIERARWLAIRTCPYLAEALAAAQIVIDDRAVCRVRVPVVRDDGRIERVRVRVPTVQSDAGWRIYIHPACAEWPAGVLAWTLACHEVAGHLLGHHVEETRAAAAKPKRANVAQDLAINSAEWPAPLTVPDFAMRAERHGLEPGHTWQWYYDRLSDGDDDDDDGDDGGGVGSGDCGSCADGVRRPWERDTDDPETPAVSHSRAEAIARHTAEAIREHAGRGTVPGALAVWADAILTPPPIDWRCQLACELRARLPVGMPEPRGGHLRREGIYSYRLRPAGARVVVVADTSGSMSGSGGTVLGAVEQIARATGECTVIWADAAVAGVERVTRGARTLRPVGGGGTDLRPAIDAARRSDADAVVVVTDGETPWPEDYRGEIVVAVGDSRSVPEAWRRRVIEAAS